MSTILYNMLSSPQQSRKSDRVIAAPFQNVSSFQHKANSFKTDAVRQVDFRSYSFPPLDPPSVVTLEKYCGPTTESNWVIPGVLLVGAYPASEDDTETFDLITGILRLGIRKFACLQLEYRDDVPPEQWRAGKGLRPYFQDVKHIVQNKTIYFPNCSEPIVDIRDLSFDHLPIVDCGVTDDERVLQLCRKLVLDITRGEVIYLHCWGGHGRTGTVVSIMLHLMYGMSATEAMARCQLVHDLRICPVAVGSPQTQTQRDQVIRIVSELQRGYRQEKLLYETSNTGNDSLNSTVRVSRSGSTDYDDEKQHQNQHHHNQHHHNPSAKHVRGGGVSGGHSFTEGIKPIIRSPNSFNLSNSNMTAAAATAAAAVANSTSAPAPPAGSPLPKTGGNSNTNGTGSNKNLMTPTKGQQFSAVVVLQDAVTERTSNGSSSVKPLPAVGSSSNSRQASSSNGMTTSSSGSVTDFHKTIPRPDSSLSPQKRSGGHSVHALREAEAEMNQQQQGGGSGSGVPAAPVDYSMLSPASTFHRKSYEMESRSPTEQLEGFSGSGGLKGLSMRTPSSEDSHHSGAAAVVVDNYTRISSLTPVNLEDLLLPGGGGSSYYERQHSTSSLPSGDRQLSTASQPMSISSEINEGSVTAGGGGGLFRSPSTASHHSEGTIKRNISCTLTPVDAASSGSYGGGGGGSEATDDNLSSQVRKASATNMNNHNFQQKEPLSQPSAASSGGGGSSSSSSSFSISQVLNVARQVLLNGGKSSPTASNTSSSSFSTMAGPPPGGSSSSSPRVSSVKTPTPPPGAAPSSSSRSSRNSRN